MGQWNIQTDDEFGTIYHLKWRLPGLFNIRGRGIAGTWFVIPRKHIVARGKVR